MDRQRFAERVNVLRREGKSIRAIALELGTYKTKVQRALKDLAEHPDPRLPTSIVAAGAFVGRQPETDQLRLALGDVLSGRPRIVLLSGEPGIGKTRLAQEFAILAAESNVLALWGRCYEGQGAPSYWPWVQLVRDYALACDARQLRSEMGPGAANIAEIVSELKAKLPGLQPPASLDSPDADRFRLFDSIASFMKNSAHSKPMMLVLEDLHWADTPSLLLLEFLAHEISGCRILIVGTSRHTESGHALSRTIGELAREPYFQQVRLPRLELSDVGQYIRETSGAPAPEDYAEAIYSRTEGNPFFMTELVRLFAQDPSTAAEGKYASEGISMPDSVRGAIRRRLEGLSETCNQALTIASVAGREFDLEVVSLLMPDISGHQLLTELEEATKLRIVDELDSAPGRYQFSHVLIQEAISKELSHVRKTHLHARIAESLEILYGDDADVHAAELAHHFAQAETLLGTGKLVRYSISAGERAIASYACEEALVHFQRALDAKGSSTSPTGAAQVVDAETATMLFGLGRAQVATFANAQGQQAVDTLRRAFDAFIDLGDTKKAVAAATHLHGFLPFSFGTADMAARALALVPPDSLEAGYLLSRYGAALSLESKDYEGAQENLGRAVEIARREGDRVLEVRSLVHGAQLVWVQGRYRESVEKLLPVIRLAQSIDELGTLAIASLFCTSALLALGDGAAAQIQATEGLKSGERFHNSAWLTRALEENTNLAILRGEWKVAQDFIDRALAGLPRDVLSLADGALLNLQLGKLDEGRNYIDQIIEIVSDDLLGAGLEHAFAAATIPLFARVTGTTELLDTAESSARVILSNPHRANREINPARAGLALIAIQRSDTESAKEQYQVLGSRRGTQLSAIICFDRLLGLLAQTMGNLEDARTHFEDALAFCRKAGYRTELAWSLHDFAGMLLERDESGDQQSAASLLDEALEISHQLGMRPLAEIITALQERTEHRAGPSISPDHPAGLTQREMEVLLLIADGKTTREIAGELVLSPRTVQRHTTNLYVKINVRNRSEATAFALSEFHT